MILNSFCFLKLCLEIPFLGKFDCDPFTFFSQPFKGYSRVPILNPIMDSIWKVKIFLNLRDFSGFFGIENVS